MRNLALQFNEKIDFIDKFLLILLILIPFALASSIFVADLFSSISGIILIYIFSKKKIIFFKKIKIEIIFMVVFYTIILISLIFTEYYKISFLASFFYFRYFLVSLSIFYLLNKYDFLFKVLLYSLVITISIIILDSFIQYFYGSNLFGYEWPNKAERPDIYNIKYVTSFFDTEKKLGSYLVRFLPLILAASYFYNEKKSAYLEIFLLVIVGVVIFYTSERTALFLYFIIIFSYIIISKYKYSIMLIVLFIFGMLFSLNDAFRYKYIDFSLQQIDGRYTTYIKDTNNRESRTTPHIWRYYSEEHENLAFTAIKIFQKKPLFGSGVKTFFHECNNLKKNKSKNDVLNKRHNSLVCSTHPHNTYLQILSDIGIFGFLMALYFFCYLAYIQLKTLIKIKKINKEYRRYYFINLGIIINILPLVPAGNIFNNWICLIIFYLIGFWLFVKNKLYEKN